MSVLSWGKPTIRICKSTSGTPSGDWQAIDTPKQDTTKLTPTAGTETTAKEEGGGIVDSMIEKNEYQLEFDLFVKKGKELPWDDDDGPIDGNWGIQVIAKDQECVSIQVDNCTLHAETNYAAADGITVHYVARCLEPANGKTVKLLTISDSDTATTSVKQDENAAA